MNNETLENLRVSYQAAKLDIEDCSTDPMTQFNNWFDQALKSHCDEPNAFTLSTVSDGQPKARVVLLKGELQGQFVFYTNYNSAKGSELKLDDKVCMTFLWLPLQRQVRIEGAVSFLSDQQSEEYFHKRPRGSQLGAVASPQSQRLNSRLELEAMFAEVETKYAGQDIPKPKHWGGYLIRPHYFEFWQGRKNRMHDRICYKKKDQSWELFRLAP
jgi:pyridoxamine 5'-phosphate oxidase